MADNVVGVVHDGACRVEGEDGGALGGGAKGGWVEGWRDSDEGKACGESG